MNISTCCRLQQPLWCVADHFTDPLRSPSPSSCALQPPSSCQPLLEFQQRRKHWTLQRSQRSSKRLLTQETSIRLSVCCARKFLCAKCFLISCWGAQKMLQSGYDGLKLNIDQILKLKISSWYIFIQYFSFYSLFPKLLNYTFTSFF